MSTVLPYHPLTSAQNSAERASLIKMDEVIGILLALVAKLDADTGVTDSNYAATLTATLQTLRATCRVSPEDFRVT